MMYIYYYLKLLLQQKLYDLQTGSAQPGINKKYIEPLIIKVVSPEEQQKIVDYCDNLQMIIDKLEENIENNNILMKTILENKLKQQSQDPPNISNTELTTQHAINDSL